MPNTAPSMKMPKPSEDAKAAFSALVPDQPAVVLRPMFGNLAAFVNGNMFAGLFGEDLFVRLPEEEASAVKRAGGRDFEPMAGRAMKGYVVVPGDWRERAAQVAPSIELALTMAQKLPVKESKGRAAKKL